MLTWVLFGIVMVFTAAVRIRLLGVPLERDEGEFAYAGQLILQGVAPYKLAYNMKFPGIYAAYALLMAIFGQTIVGVHLGLLMVNLAGITLVFLLGKRLLGPTAGLAACASYALLALSPTTVGSSAHATHFVVLFALGGLLVLLKALESGRLISFGWSGLLLGFAVTMKQPGVFFVAFALAYIVWHTLTAPGQVRGQGAARQVALRLAAFLAGAVVPIAAVFVSAWATGVFDRFWFWTVTYGSQYAGAVKADHIGRMLLSGLCIAIAQNWPIWVLAGLGAVAILACRAMRPRAVFVLGLLVFSFCAVSVGFYYRNHYFVMMFPAISLLVGCATGWVRESGLGRWMGTARAAAIVLILAAFGYPIYAHRQYLFSASPEEVCANLYSGNPFNEAVEISKYLMAHTSPEDPIAVMGSEPEIFFYSKRLSATGYIYTYSVTERQPLVQKMRQEMIGEIEATRPKYMVIVSSPLSWFTTRQADESIIGWMQDYTQRHYELVGIANMFGPGRTEYHWGREAQTSLDPRAMFVGVLRRRD